MHALLASVLILATLSPSAGATDYDREVRPGITSFKRITGGSRPQNIYAVRVDLSSPNIGLHASADVRGTEWYVDTLTFAENVDAIAAINGDWSCTTCSGSSYLHPLGLAIEDGAMWNDHISTDAIGNHWGYIGCTIGKQCDLTRARYLNHESMAFSPLRTPTVYPLRYQNAIGANGVTLIQDGAASSACFDTSSTNPRSAACLESDLTHLWLVAIDGRGAGGGTGMSCDDVRDLLLGAPFNCWDAVMLDGGGSTTLVVEDTNRSADCNPRGDNDLCVKNNPSDGSPRRVANHLGITWEDVPDGRCRTANGKWCEGTALKQCEGGRFENVGDCGAYGFTCQEDGDFAFCVDPRCPEGNGLRVAACVDSTRIASCNDGQYAVGDCAGFGLVCGTDGGGSACMDARCAAGPDSAFCASGSVVGACTDGVYTESGCPAGTSCAADGAGPYCSDDRCPSPDGATCSGDVLESCSRGAYTTRDCAAEGLVCADGACVAPGGGDPGGGGGEDPGEDPEDPTAGPQGAALPGGMTPLDEVGCVGGCAAGAQGGVGVEGAFGAFLAMLVARRRRA
jgi:exopolysaccharide biosynthesis protein